MFELVGDGENAKSRWLLRTYRRLHTHDVRSLAWIQFPNSAFDAIPPSRLVDRRKRKQSLPLSSDLTQEPAISVDFLISGGVDCNLTAMKSPQSRFPFKSLQPVRLSPILSSRLVCVSQKARLLLANVGNALQLSKLGAPSEANEEDDAHPQFQNLLSENGFKDADAIPLHSNAKNLLEIKLKDNLGFQSFAVSSNGHWIAAVDGGGSLRVFRISFEVFPPTIFC